MARKPNDKPPEQPQHVITFLPHEFARFKRYNGGGGLQQFVTWIFNNTDRQTLVCSLNAERFERLVRYIRRYGPGGPQQILRDSCIPALRRIGIDLSWS
jgi:hypothetical protein